MGFFGNNNTGVSLSKRQQLEAKFTTARNDLLLIVAFTVVNIVLLVTGSDTYFIFSAFIPYVVANLGMSLCGKFPNEYYEEIGSEPILGDNAFVAFIAVSIVLTLLYLLCWYMSKNFKSGWIIFGLVMISIDTALLLFCFSLDSVIDLLFHIWMIVSMSIGLSANKKLKELPEEPEEEFIPETETPQEEPVAKLNDQDINE